MKIPTFESTLDVDSFDLDVDGFDLNEIAGARVAVKNKRLSMPKRAAWLDSLPVEYRIGLPDDVDKARKQYLEYLRQ